VPLPAVPSPSPATSTNASGAHALHLLLLATFALVAYLPSFDVPFLFDDLPNIVHNPTVHALATDDLARVLDSKVSASRPVALLTFALNHLVGGLDPVGYHAVNLVLHIVNGLLLYVLLLILAPGGSTVSRLAFFGALLWLLHPVQTQAVTYIVQRMTMLGTFCYLVGMLAFVLQRRGRLATLPAVLAWGSAFVLGMASKEIVATLPLACLLIEACFFGQRPRHPRALAWFAGAALLTCLLLAALYLPGLPEWTARYPNRDFSPLQRLLTEPRVLWHYLSLFAWPLPERLHLDYQVTLSHGWWQPTSTLPAVIGLGLLAGVGWWWRRRQPLACFALLFFLLASALEASFVNLEIAFIHRLYLPSLFLAAGLLSLVPSRLLARATVPLFLVAAALALATVERNREWVDENRFWALELERGASLFRALLNRGSTLVELGYTREAVRLLEQSLPLVSAQERPVLELQIAAALFAMESFPAARARLESLRESAGDREEILFLLALTHVKEGNPEAVMPLAKQLASAPGFALEARLVSALIAGANGDTESALTDLTALRAGPPPLEPALDELVAMQLADLHLATGRLDAARELYLEAVERRPANHFAWRQLYRLADSLGDRDQTTRIRSQLDARGVAIPPSRDGD
jgi:tetratricopeptide (TPR) repeat protein